MQIHRVGFCALSVRQTGSCCRNEKADFFKPFRFAIQNPHPAVFLMKMLLFIIHTAEPAIAGVFALSMVIEGAKKQKNPPLFRFIEKRRFF